MLKIKNGIESAKLSINEIHLLSVWIELEDRWNKCWVTHDMLRAHFTICNRTCQVVFDKIFPLSMQPCPCGNYLKEEVLKRAKEFLKFNIEKRSG